MRINEKGANNKGSLTCCSDPDLIGSDQYCQNFGRVNMPLQFDRTAYNEACVGNFRNKSVYHRKYYILKKTDISEENKEKNDNIRNKRRIFS